MPVTKVLNIPSPKIGKIFPIEKCLKLAININKTLNITTGSISKLTFALVLKEKLSVINIAIIKVRIIKS